MTPDAPADAPRESSEDSATPTPTGRRPKKLWKRLVEYGFYALFVGFIVAYLVSIDYGTFQDVQPLWWALAVATVLALSFRYWGAFIWTTLLRSLGAEGVRLDANLLYVYAKSWLGRYIPGTAPWILGKIYFAAEHGVSKSKLGVSSLLEGALQVIVQMLFALALLASDDRLEVLPSGWRVTFYLVIAGCTVALLPPVFNNLLSLALRVLRRGPLPAEHRASLRTIATGFGLYAVGAVVGGLSLFFIAKTVYPTLPYSQMTFVMGASTLAGAASMLAVFVPGGIGVREGIQVVLLGLVMPTDVALLVAVTSRLHAVAIDLAFYGLATLQVSRHRQASERAATP